MRPLLVTGFEPFGGHRTNPSQRVVEALAPRPELRTAVLPVAYRRADAQLMALLEATRPRGLLLLGLHAGATLRLERFARNRDDAQTCDEDGERRAGRAIAGSGPAVYASTLPLGAFAEALTTLSLPWQWSDDAGGFLCNHVFYGACAWIERTAQTIPCGFLHLPPLDAIALEHQVAGVVACLDRLAGSAAAPRSVYGSRSGR